MFVVSGRVCHLRYQDYGFIAKQRKYLDKHKYRTCKGCRKTVNKLWDFYRDSSGGWCSKACYEQVSNFNKYANERYAPHEMRMFLLKRDNYTCQYCKVSITNETANMEHVIPFPEGKTIPTNLVVACRACNKKKYLSNGYSLLINDGKYLVKKPDHLLPEWARNNSSI